jgi:hypothetical protein
MRHQYEEIRGSGRSTAAPASRTYGVYQSAVQDLDPESPFDVRVSHRPPPEDTRARRRRVM